MKVKIIQMIILLTALLLIGCNIFNPSESDARAEFEKKWEKEIKEGTVIVTKFRKTDGQAGEFAGVRIYTLDYEAEIEYPKGLNPQCRDTSKFSWDCLGAQSMGQIRDVGEKQAFEDKIIFEKTEKGWRAVSRVF